MLRFLPAAPAVMHAESSGDGSGSRRALPTPRAKPLLQRGLRGSGLSREQFGTGRLLRQFLAALAMLGMASLAQASTEAAANLVKLLSAVNSMQASFTQQTVDAKGRPQAMQSGTMSVKRPGLFRWEVQKPAPQLVLTTGKVLWIYDPELMQATKQQLDDQVGNTPALLLSGDPRKLSEAFEIAEEKGRADRVFLLKPRGKDALFESLRVRFQGGKLVEMELADTMSQRTDIRFSEIRVNPALGAQHFEFVPPKGTDVIDQL